MKRVLTAQVKFNANFLFDERLLDPMNAIELAREKGKFLADVARHFDREWDETVESLRKQFAAAKLQTDLMTDIDRVNEIDDDAEPDA